MNIEIYTKPFCLYCHRAKALLDSKGLKYKEIDVSSDQDLQQEMRERSERRTVPQIFIDGHHIGGSDELATADNDGSLENFIQGKAVSTA